VRYDRLLMGDRIGFPLVHSDVDFGHPLRFGDRPVVRVTCTQLGRSSVTLRYVFKLDETVCVDARMTTVCTNLVEMKSFPLPPEYRASFEQILETRT
jgi:4-hydroxybenzoyl-CoA thioesterase